MNPTYWKKQGEKPLFPDLEWSRPEQKTGNLTIIGGSSAGFSGVNAAMSTALDLPIKKVEAILPDSLKTKLPSAPEISFAPANSSGGFSKESLKILQEGVTGSALIVGDLGKNSETAITISNLITSTEGHFLLTRDAIDLILPDSNKILEKKGTTFLATLPQLQKLFRTIYYPKVILLSMPLTALVETLHKFTITYEATIITFHQNQIIIAHDGEVVTTSLSSTSYSPLTLWSGALATKIAANQIWHPEKPLESASIALLNQLFTNTHSCKNPCIFLSQALN